MTVKIWVRFSRSYLNFLLQWSDRSFLNSKKKPGLFVNTSYRTLQNVLATTETSDLIIFYISFVQYWLLNEREIWQGAVRKAFKNGENDKAGRI